jgi:hypothetical protein
MFTVMEKFIMQSISAAELSVNTVEGGFALAAGNEVLRTPKGNVLQHSSEELMLEILTMLRGQGGITLESGAVSVPVSMSPLYLLTDLLDVVIPETGTYATDFVQALLADPVLYTIPGPEQISRDAAYECVRAILETELPPLRRHVTELQSRAFELEPDTTDVELSEEAEAAIEQVKWLYSILSPEQKAVINALTTLHSGSILMAMSLMISPLGSPVDYADGVIAALMLDGKQFADVSSKETITIRQLLEQDAQAAMNFLAHTNDDQDWTDDEEGE